MILGRAREREGAPTVRGLCRIVGLWLGSQAPVDLETSFSSLMDDESELPEDLEELAEEPAEVDESLMVSRNLLQPPLRCSPTVLVRRPQTHTKAYSLAIGKCLGR